MKRSAARAVFHALAVSVAIPSIVFLAAALSSVLVFTFPALVQAGPNSSRPGLVVQGPYDLLSPIVQPAEEARAPTRRSTTSSHPPPLATFP